MLIKSVELKNFRLHKQSVLNFSDKLNFIVGGNGQGKTSILEAIYYLCTTKSLNQSTDAEAVNFDEDFFEVVGSFQDRTSNKLKVNYNLPGKKKSVYLNEKYVSRAADIIGKFPVVTLTQSDHDITQSSPSNRRNFVDSVISQASKAYLDIYLDYNKTLRQRSSLLSQIKETKESSLLNQLEVWNSTLVKSGAEIIKHRLKFIEEFNDYVKEAYKNIMASEEFPEINYSSFCEFEDDVEEKFFEQLEKKREVELIRATNLVGPHRDDLIFNINNFELRKYGSQGQHKTFQIALRFAQFFYLKDKLGVVPIFLMDDIFGELDTYRAKKISDYLNEVGQGFITMTDFTNYEGLLSESDLLINVKNGKISYGK